MSDKLGLWCWYTTYICVYVCVCVSALFMESNLLIFHVQEHPMDKINNLFISFSTATTTTLNRNSFGICFITTDNFYTLECSWRVNDSGKFDFHKIPSSNTKFEELLMSPTLHCISDRCLQCHRRPHTIPPSPPTITHQVSVSCARHTFTTYQVRCKSGPNNSIS